MKHEPQKIDEETLVKIVRLLLASEVKTGGPYKTWLVKSQNKLKWQDIDLAVNANVNYLLSLVASPMENVTNYLDKAIEEDDITSKYYPDVHPLLYYLSRGYKGKHRNLLIKRLKKELKKRNNILEDALLVIAALHLDPSIISEDIILKLIKSQSSDGAWRAEAFCLDPSIEGVDYYHGAEVLTTAFVIEAINMYQDNKVKHMKKSILMRVLIYMKRK